MPLTDTLARSIAGTVAPLIVQATTPAGKDPPVVQPTGDNDPAKNWEKIVEIIVKEVFKQIKENAVIEVKELIQINVAGATLSSAPGGGVVAGSIIGPGSTVDLKGKVT